MDHKVRSSTEAAQWFAALRFLLVNGIDFQCSRGLQHHFSSMKLTAVKGWQPDADVLAH
jgi:hypothetical protein